MKALGTTIEIQKIQNFPDFKLNRHHLLTST